MAMRLCVGRILPGLPRTRCKIQNCGRSRAVRYSPAMKAITTALADDEITLGESAQDCGSRRHTFVRAVETSSFDHRLQELEGRFKARDPAAAMASGRDRARRDRGNCPT